jgi:hypothetical protein
LLAQIDGAALGRLGLRQRHENAHKADMTASAQRAIHRARLRFSRRAELFQLHHGRDPAYHRRLFGG